VYLLKNDAIRVIADPVKNKEIWHYVSRGTRPHIIEAKNAPMLVFMWGFARYIPPPKSYPHGAVLPPAGEARKVASAFALVEKGKKLVKQGKVEEAISAYEKAQELDPTLVISASSWNILGRFGSLCGSPSEVMYACEKAVALEPANVQCRDTRGLARALTGDHTRAIEDFQFYIELGKIQQPEESILKRQNWIQELKAGRNPFDEATLEALRNE